MKFRSYTEMAQYYIDKLMKDGEGHSCQEITDYVMAKLLEMHDMETEGETEDPGMTLNM